VVSDVGLINEVNQHRTRLVLGWPKMGDRLRMGKPSRPSYVGLTSQLVRRDGLNS